MQTVHNTVVVFAFAMNAIIDHSLDASYFGGNAENEVHNTHVRAVQQYLKIHSHIQQLHASTGLFAHLPVPLSVFDDCIQQFCQIDSY